MYWPSDGFGDIEFGRSYPALILGNSLVDLPLSIAFCELLAAPPGLVLDGNPLRDQRLRQLTGPPLFAHLRDLMEAGSNSTALWDQVSSMTQDNPVV